MKNTAIGYADQYGTGAVPTVSIKGNTVVELHQSQSLETLWYQVATLEGGWANFSSSHQIDDGANPCIAMTENNIVVEVHESNGLSSNMWYSAGKVDISSKTINWEGSSKYDTGKKPKIAVNNSDVIIEVHESDGPSSNMWYHVGTVDTTNLSVNWGGSHKYDKGATPSVAVNNNNVVIEVHQSQGPSSSLWYHVGIVDSVKKTIDWGSSVNYDTGSTPSVTLTDDNIVIEVHKSQTFDTLWKRIGKVNTNSKSIEWMNGSAEQYTNGASPYISSDSGMVVEVHSDGSSLLCSASLLIDRGNWMNNSLPTIGGKTLQEIIMPASHDASMYKVNDCVGIAGFGANACNTQTQIYSYLEQLESGIRYFDVRPVMYNSILTTGHYNTSPLLGCNGPTLATALDDVKTFFNESSELVILKFSHYLDRDNSGSDFSEAQIKQVCDLTISTLGDILYTGPTPLANTPINDMLSQGGRVIAVFDELSENLRNQYAGKGIYSYSDYNPDKGKPDADLTVYDKYSDTNNLDKMISGQIGYMNNPANHGGDLFLLSWTLTQSNEQAIACGALQITTSILDLAAEANPALWQNMVNQYKTGQIKPGLLPNLLYHDAAQGFATDVAIWLNNNGNFPA